MDSDDDYAFDNAAAPFSSKSKVSAHAPLPGRRHRSSARGKQLRPLLCSCLGMACRRLGACGPPHPLPNRPPFVRAFMGVRRAGSVRDPAAGRPAAAAGQGSVGGHVHPGAQRGRGGARAAQVQVVRVEGRGCPAWTQRPHCDGAGRAPCACMHGCEARNWRPGLSMPGARPSMRRLAARCACAPRLSAGPFTCCAPTDQRQLCKSPCLHNA